MTRQSGPAIIPLVPPLLAESSDLPESYSVAAVYERRKPRAVSRVHKSPLQVWRGGPPLLSYLVLLRVGFSLPPASLPGRCALAPQRGVALRRPHLFTLTQSRHGEPRSKTRRYIFCGTVRAGGVRPCGIPLRPSLLASTLPCGVRTFLFPVHASQADPEESARRPDRAAIARLARASSMITGKRCDRLPKGPAPGRRIHLIIHPMAPIAARLARILCSEP